MENAVKKIDIRVAKERELKAKIAFNGLTQREVAIRVGVSPALVCRVIGGSRSSKRVLQFFKHLPLTEMKEA